MCGICGIIHPAESEAAQLSGLMRMNETMRHRGPDDYGRYLDPHAALAMRRLSIIDLHTGQQPITNEEGTLHLVFNGEIYNHRALRAELEKKGHRFKSHSDSEAIIHAYEAFGPDCVQRLNGMFAFAIWDAHRQQLFLARDRLGIKPLYYWTNDRSLIFGSELKAVIAHPAVPRSIDPVALDHFLTLEYIPAPRTIFQNIHKLPPGHTLTFANGRYRHNHCDLTPYWQLPTNTPPARSEADYLEELTTLIHDAVGLRLMSDVPLGAFLSGGIDSSTVVSFMREAGADTVRTFSIGFDDQTYNELPYARLVARHLHTRHQEEILKPDILTLAQKLVGHLDEPLGDFSILPTYLVSEMAGKHVKVILSGDGGDELFGGYDTYVAQRAATFYGRLPAPIRRRWLPAFMDALPPQPAKKGLINKAKRFVEGATLPANLQHTRWMMFLQDADKAQLYHPNLRQALNGHTIHHFFTDHFQQATALPPLGQQQYVDIKTYLVDNILTKVDRMSMAASIEVRVPLLDYRIVEFALRLPPNLKMRGRETKYLLRRVAEKRLPQEILTKPKQGFSIPMKHWLRSTLKPMMVDALSTDSVARRGYFDPKTVQQWQADHLEGRANHSHRLWALIVLELWLRQVESESYP